MKKILPYSTCVALLAACLLFCSCQKEVAEDNQRKALETYITETLKKPIDERDGVYFVMMDSSPITPRVEVVAGDEVEFVYAAWSYGGAVFVTNDDSIAATKNLTPTPIGAVKVGEGNVIAGLDKGLQCMALGDHSLILFPFTLGYGEQYVGQVPPESALIFEVIMTKVNGVSF